MAGMMIPHVLMAFCAIVALNCVSTLPRDITFPIADENLVKNLETAPHPPSVNNQTLKMPEQEEKPKSCFHFFVSRNMSSLLAEATKMLRTIRDRREREWILTFIYRIKSLAEHLRAHPESRNYDCLPTDDEAKKRILSDNVRGPQQPELYFIDDVPRRSIEGEIVPDKMDDKSTNDNQESRNPPREEQSNPTIPPVQDTVVASNNKDYAPTPSKLQMQSSSESPSGNNLDGQSDISKQDMTSPDQNLEAEVTNESKDVPTKKGRTLDSGIVLSSVPDCDSPTECGKGQLSSSPEVPRENYFADAGNIYPAYQSDDAREQDLNAAEIYQQEVLKERIRKALLEELAPEMKKLRAVGGTEDDLLGLWNYIKEDKSTEENEVDFDYEETGAAAGDLNLNEKVQPDRTVAPSLDEVQSSKESLNTAKDSSYEPYDDSDVLVQQLFDVRFNNPPSKTTKSLSDQNNEYLITSTHTPF